MAWEYAYVVSIQLLFLVQLTVHLVDTGAEVGRVTAESNIKVLQETVAAGQKRFRGVGTGVDTGLAIEDNDSVSQVSGHDEIVLNDECRLLGVHDETLDDTGSNDTLLRVQVGRRLVNDVDVSRNTKGKHDGNTLQFTTGQVLDFLVNEILELEGLDDISLELGRQECRTDLLEEQLADSSVELGGNSLGLHADLHFWDLLGAVGLQGTGQKFTESSLSRSVLSHHDDDFGIGEITSFDVQVEASKGLLHLGVAESADLVNHEVIGTLRKTESQRFITESQVFCRDMAVEEDVDAFTDRVRKRYNTVDGGSTVEYADVVGEVVENRQIVFNNDDIVVGLRQRANDTSSSQTLLDIQVRGGLVKHVNIGFLDTDSSDGKSLQLTTRELVNLTVHEMAEFEGVQNLVQVAQRGAAFQKALNRPLRATDSLRDLIDILRLDDGLQVILEDLGEVVLELGASEVLDHVVPIRGVFVAAQVGLELAAENLQCRALSNTVGSDQTQNVSRSGHRQTVELEAVGRVSMGDLRLEIGRQVDNRDSAERALLRADTTSDLLRISTRCRDRGARGLQNELGELKQLTTRWSAFVLSRGL